VQAADQQLAGRGHLVDLLRRLADDHPVHGSESIH
jgi:hypothetical protein